MKWATVNFRITRSDFWVTAAGLYYLYFFLVSDETTAAVWPIIMFMFFYFAEKLIETLQVMSGAVLAVAALLMKGEVECQNQTTGNILKKKSEMP